MDNGKVKWEFTDPMNKLDVFFWDQSNQFTKPLRQVLDQQSAKFVFRRVNSVQANAFDSGKPETGADVLNQNSITLSKQKGFSVVYAQRTISTRVGQLRTLGKTEQPILNNGKPIIIDYDAIRTFAATTRFPQATLIAQVVAHETGHRFGQRHSFRPSCCAFVPLSLNQITGLTVNQVAFPGAQSRFLYVRLTRYTDPTGTVQIGDAIDLSPYAVRWDGMVPIVRTRDSATTPVYEVSLTGPLLAPAESVGVAIQQLEIMDWTPNLNLTTPAQWHFDPTNLNQLCVRSVCQR